MAFPFNIKYSRSFSRELTEEERVRALFYIRGFILDKSADNVQVVKDSVIYKGSKSAFNWNVFMAVDKGIFKIIQEEDKTIITYEIVMYQLFIFVSVFGVIGLIITRSFFVLIPTFGWVGGMNWILSYGRHTGILDEIKEGIDAQLGIADIDQEKKDISLEKNDQSEKLKSWF